MLNYNAMTLGKIIEEVITRVGKFRNNVNVDYYTLALMVYHAQNEIMSMTLPYKDWAYVSTIDITNGTVLPREYKKYIRVLITNKNNVEARYATPQEYYKTTQQSIIWSNSYSLQPIYTLWGIKDTTSIQPEAQIVIYVSPIDSIGIMDCYIYPQFTDDNNSQMIIPYEFENLLVLSVLQRIMSKLADKEKISQLQKDILLERNKIVKLMLAKKQTEKIELDTFISPDSQIVQQVNEGKQI